MIRFKARTYLDMKLTGKYAVVLVTAPDLKTGRKLARAALEARVIACARDESGPVADDGFVRRESGDVRNTPISLERNETEPESFAFDSAR